MFPAEKAAYPSSVLMNIIPAKVAGVDEIIMVTPPGKDGRVTPTTLVAAKEAGADKVYKAGGAQAIAALAYGDRKHPEGGQDRRTRKYLCSPGKKSCVRACEHRFRGRAERDSRSGR